MHRANALGDTGTESGHTSDSDPPHAATDPACARGE
jgi:hypothetical protein